jgi:hypothetical protein
MISRNQPASQKPDLQTVKTSEQEAIISTNRHLGHEP